MIQVQSENVIPEKQNKQQRSKYNVPNKQTNNKIKTNQTSYENIIHMFTKISVKLKMQYMPMNIKTIN